MSEPFLSEIKVCAFNYAPRGWAMCNGQPLPINQNQALFSLLGTTFGGDGRVNFALPDFRGRVPFHVGSSFVLGQRAGEQAHTLSVAELPPHAHLINASTAQGNDPNPGGHLLASPLNRSYRPPDGVFVNLAEGVGNVGGSQAHLNMQPFLALNFLIALQGIFPSPN